MTLDTLKLHQKIYDQVYHTPFSQSANMIWFDLSQQVKNEVNYQVLAKIQDSLQQNYSITQVQRPIRQNLSEIEFK